MRRRVVILLLASACLVDSLVCAGFLYLRQPREGTAGRLYQIRDGMTRAEVEAIMGRPPDEIGDLAMPTGWAGPPDTVLFWKQWNYEAAVVFRQNRIRFCKVRYLNHQPTLVDRWAPTWMQQTSPPAWLDGWWPQ